MEINPLSGADEHLVDAESMGEMVMKPLKLAPAEEVLRYLERKLQEGYFIYMTDLDGPLLREVTDDNGDEGVATNITLAKMENRPKKITPGIAPRISYRK
jgi:hypothetical protein